MSSEAKLLIGFGVVIALVFGGGLLLAGNSIAPTSSKNLIESDSIQTGPANAKVTVVEFADFQCPACAAQAPTLERVITEYQGRVNFVFRHFPLPQHGDAKFAAYAGEAANDQGKFWQMYQALYQTQNEWNNISDPTKYFTDLAAKVGINDPSFQTKLNDGRYAGKVGKDQAAGQNLGVNSTPTIFINGVKQIGVTSYETFKQILDSDLR